MKLNLVIFVLLCFFKSFGQNKVTEIFLPTGTLENENEFVIFNIQKSKIYVHKDTLNNALRHKIKTVNQDSTTTIYHKIKEQLQADYVIKGNVNYSLNSYLEKYDSDKTNFNPSCLLINLLLEQKAFLFFNDSFVSSIRVKRTNSKIILNDKKGKKILGVKNCT
ncbi:hypothetical protein K6119_09935 [Paracrocinitomix mangrovi]|uniref:hypothetical protein n=1 Tax=Paracrocinitomix mangrovi TaxID=2862509 RepID=UPI001C8D3A69|nr:hypothetical protein [Paracrocinitomix mangrovi]UKN03810.1 hypothetical protein K6119_09935 [Paracrocinitomix mangrovi]